MSYFSNHSNQSRFLAISSSSAASSQAPSQTHSQQPAQAPALQSRRSTSKLFSTSVDAHSHGEGRDAEDESLTPTVHPLRNTWVFWFRQQRTPGNKIISYEEGIKRIASFISVESFWSLHTHLVPPSQLIPTTDYLLFHTGIARPIWEDPLNITGGKWIIRLRKGVADRLWEALVCAVVGDIFADCREPRTRENWEDGSDASGADGDASGEEEADAYPEICGCTISVRQSEDIVSLWNRIERDSRVRERIRDTLRQVLNLPQSTIMEYKSNNDSMQDKSSFRNSAIDRTPLA